MSDENTPSQGDIIAYADYELSIPRWKVARVVKAGRVMWELELLDLYRKEFGVPQRRKVSRWVPVVADPVKAGSLFREAEGTMYAAHNAAAEEYQKSCIAIAAGETPAPEIKP